MGFGTLFFGYFLILNIAYYTFTDTIAALVMALGLYKLSSVNRPFKGAFYSAFPFAALGIFELVVQILSMFNNSAGYEKLLSYTDTFRYVIIVTVTLFILLGIESVSAEVGLSALARRARYSMPFSLVIYLIMTILGIPNLQVIIDVKILVWLSVISQLAAFAMTVINLITIYRAYMKICMPDEKDNIIPDKPSRFEFVNKHREHTQQKQKEYIEYKLDKMQKKASNKNNKKK